MMNAARVKRQCVCEREECEREKRETKRDESVLRFRSFFDQKFFSRRVLIIRRSF